MFLFLFEHIFISNFFLLIILLRKKEISIGVMIEKSIIFMKGSLILSHTNFSFKFFNNELGFLSYINNFHACYNIMSYYISS